MASMLRRHALSRAEGSYSLRRGTLTSAVPRSRSLSTTTEPRNPLPLVLSRRVEPVETLSKGR